MLTPSGNQYLRPEYLSPLPTTLDAKKSPLALLAQTCSNIGADSPSAKSLIPPVEKSSKDAADKPPREKSTPLQTDDKSSFKPYECIKKESSDSGVVGDEKSGFRTPTSKSSSPSAVSSTGSVNSDKGSSPAVGTASSTDGGGSKTTQSTEPPMPATSVASSTLHAQHNRISIGCGSMFVEVNHHESALPKDSGLGAAHHHLPLGYLKTGQLVSPGVLSHHNGLGSLSASNCAGCTQVVGHVPVDTASSNPSYPPGIATQSGNPLKGANYPLGSSLSPYVAYARVKTATGAMTLVPICRDPYCNNCQLSMQNAQQLVNPASAPTCPSGCTQCTHEKLAVAAAGLAGVVPGMPSGPLSALVPGIPGVSVANPMSLVGSGLYSHSMLTPRPYVCNWIAGDTYCGKRFSTSEELLQHLRTHTNLSASESVTLPLLNPSLSLPSAGSLGSCHLHYSMAPSLTSPAGLHRTYPTSLSPVSSLSASRYHPYKPPLGGLPGAPLTPFPPHPGLGAAQYFSPYSIYGQRLGAAVHP